jgi:hypothetical protein
MIIVRLLFSEPVGWLRHHQLYLDLGADIVMESITRFEPQSVILSVIEILQQFALLTRLL